MKTTNVKSNCIIKIKIVVKIQCIKIYKNYNEQCFYKRNNFESMNE